MASAAIAAASGAVGAGSGLIGTIINAVQGSQHLALQKEQLKLNQQALVQNKELTLRSFDLARQLPFINAQASGAATKAQLDARQQYLIQNGADPLSILSFAQGKTVWAGGHENVAVVHNTRSSTIGSMPGTHSNTPILIDMFKKKPKTTTHGTQTTTTTNNGWTQTGQTTRPNWTQTRTQSASTSTSTQPPVARIAVDSAPLSNTVFSTPGATVHHAQIVNYSSPGYAKIKPATHFYHL